ncbi:hypothetical protein ABPG75_000024 [Micractinium tetrahymenae]
MPRRGDGEEDAMDWECLPRIASTQQERQRHKPAELPVRAPAHDAKAGGEWVAAASQAHQWAATSVHMRVEGVTVVDDLAQNQQRQAKHREQEQRKAQDQEKQQARKRKAEGAQGGPDPMRRVRTVVGLGPNGAQADEARRQAAKQQLATVAQQLLQDPERQLPQLKALLELLRDKDGQVGRLAMLTLLAVFKDLLPAYRIRPVFDEDGSDKLSKEVRALRAYERALLDGYHTYLQALQQAFQRSSSGQAQAQHGRIAVKCMAGLLQAAPHFNYRSDLLQALVTCLLHKDPKTRDSALGGLSTLLAGSHGDGEVATEAVQLIADLVRRLKCITPPASLDCLLSLRFPDIVAPISPSGDSSKKKKLKKAEDGVDRSFLEAQAAADLAGRRHNQTATVEALFELLFRVLKTCTASSTMQEQEGSPLSRAQFMKRFPLVFPALRLLSKNVHLLGMEYIQDIVGELRLLLRSSALPPEERLRVLLTAAELVKCEGDVLSTDHGGFYLETYAALVHTMLVPLLEGGTAVPTSRASAMKQEEDSVLTAMIASADASTKAGEQVCFLVSSILQAVVVDTKALDAARQAAFAKRMLAVAGAAGDSGLAMGLLCLLHRMLRRSRRLQTMLQHEAGGPAAQGCQPGVTDPGEAGALSAPFWELSLLAKHYHPHIAAASRQLAAGSPTGLLPLAGAAAAFSAAYSTCTGGFRP